MYKINDILFTVYGIQPARMEGEGIAVKGIFDLPKRIGDTARDWAEADSVEPYVAADELFFEGRTIQFSGILLGDRATVLGNIAALKAAIADFTDLVPLETPYGNACVYVKSIAPKLYNGGASILIEFREPVMGAACGVAVPPTVYFSSAFSDSADKNNCQSGYHGSTEILTAPAGAFQSTVSQAAADQLAINWVLENKQANANNIGSCINNPPVWYNVKLTAQLQRDDCAIGYTGSIVTYTVEPFTYSSLISQADADQKAQDEIDTIFTQAYSNANGSCVLNLFSMITRISNTVTGMWPNVILKQVFEVGPYIRPGSEFIMTAYGATLRYFVIGTDTPSTVAQALVSLINATSEAVWSANFSAPTPGTLGFPPVATYIPSNRLEVTLNARNTFLIYVDNHD